MNLNGILIGSENPQRLADYYTRLFGEPGWAEGEYRGWLIGSGAVTVGPHDQVHGQNPEPGRIIWNIESADVVADFARLKAAAPRSSGSPTTPARPPRRGSRRSPTPTTTTSSS